MLPVSGDLLKPAKLRQEAVWLVLLPHWRLMEYLVIFSRIKLNSHVVAVAKPMLKWLKMLHGIQLYPSDNHIQVNRSTGNCSLQVHLQVKVLQNTV